MEEDDLAVKGLVYWMSEGGAGDAEADNQFLSG
jgi:hypothetical protein